MQSNVDIVIQKDGFKSKLYYFPTPNPPSATILILHGMAEHYKRYLPFAAFLNSHNIDVYLYNHRGHGEDNSLERLGYISHRNGHILLIEDGITILNHINVKKRTKQFILMGHSMGSLIVRNMLLQVKNPDGVILCGTTYPPYLKLTSGLFLSKVITWIYGAKHKSPLFNSILFGQKQYKKLTKRTSFDWLSRNKDLVGEYIGDPYCGFICSISFYHNLLMLALLARKLPDKNLPIYLISGDKDAVGGYAQEVKKLFNQFIKQGNSSVTLKLYEEARHELLQEVNKEEVMMDILNWIQKIS